MERLATKATTSPLWQKLVSEEGCSLHLHSTPEAASQGGAGAGAGQLSQRMHLSGVWYARPCLHTETTAG